MKREELNKEAGQNWIDYAMSVNTDRAIPNAKDGLKPVAKRIIYGSFHGGRTSNKAYVKNARIVGDVMGAFHPHGDSSIYGALVRLSQEWVMRYPLIDFHGNKGNVIGDGPASMRYTEGRLAKITEDGLLAGIKKGNVDFIPNYDETEEEPVVLPSIFPNLLCNPNEGIGVALACKWAPHNLGEVATAIFDYMDEQEPMLPGPDFPGGGIIINSKDIPSIMKTGKGTVKIRARYEVNKQTIIFTEIPYGTQVESILNEIGECADSGEITGILEARDQTGKNGVRIVVLCEKGENPDSIAQKLFNKTSLQSSFSYNQVALVDGVPVELNLKDAIEVYVKHNLECIEREAKFDLQKQLARLEIVKGLLRALEDIDNIIALIKKSKSSADAKDKLIEVYKFTEPQAKAIVSMRLGSLASLEKIELNEEKESLDNSIEKLNALINSEDLKKIELKDRLNAIVKKYGDKRRTKLLNIEITKEEKEIEAVAPEDVVVVVAQSGDVKRVPLTNFKTQRRNGKGIKSDTDAILETISTNTVDKLMIFTDKGKMYQILVDNIPSGTNLSKGVNISTLVKMDANEKVAAVTSLYRKSQAKYAVFITKQGMVKKTKLEEYLKTKRNCGIAAIKLKDGDSLANVLFLNEEDIVLTTKIGMAIKFVTKDIAPIGKIAMGVKGIKLGENDFVVCGLPIHKNSDDLVTVTEKGNGKRIKLSDIPLQGRGGKGVQISKESLAGTALVDDTDTLLLMGRPNSICISAKDIPLLDTRTSAGNSMIKNSTIIKVIKL